MLEQLKERVFRQNLELVRRGLVILTWGNVSAIDRASGLVVIKPSGVAYDGMTAGDMVVTDLSGKVVEGKLKPSSDTPTHIYLYNTFPSIGGVVHTHSENATAFAQAGLRIVPFGTTHADAFYGEVPCSRALTSSEIEAEYEINTGKVIAEAFVGRDPSAAPACLVKSHGPFIWGPTPEKAVENAATLEAVAAMAFKTLALNPSAERADSRLLDKHYFRKHGENAYYGQNRTEEK